MALPSTTSQEPGTVSHFLSSSLGPQGCSSADLAVPVCLVGLKIKILGNTGAAFGGLQQRRLISGGHVPGLWQCQTQIGPAVPHHTQGPGQGQSLGPIKATLLHSGPCMLPPPQTACPDPNIPFIPVAVAVAKREGGTWLCRHLMMQGIAGLGPAQPGHRGYT